MAPIDRRTFLTGLVATAAAGLTACSSDSSESDNGAGDGSGATTTAPGGGEPEDLGTSGLASSPFTLGVASGDPVADSVILWTRLALDPAAADGAGGMPPDDLAVRWEIAEDDSFGTLVVSGDEPAVAALGHSVHVDAGGLEADREYHYRFRIGEYTSAVGRTRTAPADDADVAELRVALASCQDFQAGHYAAWRSIAADELDLVFFLGDYIYESAGNPAALRPVPGGTCITLADYRNRYAHYRSDPDLQAAHASCPWIVTWDDHEVENNYADLVSGAGATPEAFAEQRAGAYQAYYEHQAIRLDPPDGPDWEIHRQSRWGTLADIFVLDGRQYRGDQPCDSGQDAFVDSTQCDIEGAALEMLGADQESFLIDGLTAATATWKVVAQQTVMKSLVLGNVVLNVDQWDGYPAARRRLLDHIASEAIADVVVLTGDIHAAAASVLDTDGTNGAVAPVAVELVTTSISSTSLGQAVRDAIGIDPAALDPTSFGLAYAELLHRGYTRCTITPGEWVAEFMTVTDVADPDSDVVVDATVVIEAGTPAVRLR